MTNRQVRFISRIIVVTIVAAVAGLAARIAFESTELVKVIGEGGLRDLLILASPVSTLVLLHFSPDNPTVLFQRSQRRDDDGMCMVEGLWL